MERWGGRYQFAVKPAMLELPDTIKKGSEISIKWGCG